MLVGGLDQLPGTGGRRRGRRGPAIAERG
jgi:hypothetical protein